MSSPVPSPQDDASVLRQLKLLVFLLLLSNVALGLFAFYFLRGIDRKYSTLIGDTIPTLNDLQELTVSTSEAMHGTNPAFMQASDGSQATFVQRGREALEREREMRERILSSPWFATNEVERQNLRQVGETFDSGAKSVLDLLGTGKMEEATQERERSLRTDYERYVVKTRESTQRADSDSLHTSDMIALRTGSVSKLLLGLGSWPVIMLGLFLSIFTIFVVAVLLNVFLRREQSL